MGRLKNDPFKDVHSNLLHPLFLALKPDGSMVSRVLDRRLSDLDPTRFGPCRASPNYEQRRHYCGKYPFGAAQVLVGFESLLELTCLMELDHGGEVTAIVDQPFCLKFPDGTAHYPDFAAVLASGGGKLVVDVKPAEHASSESFVHAAALTESVCRAQGWGYRAMHGCTGWAADNLEWICAFRYGGFAPSVEQADDLASFLAIPHTIADAALHLDARTESGIGYGQLFNLMFHRRVMPAEPGPYHPGLLVVAAQGGVQP